MAWSLPPSGDAPEESSQPLAEINVTPMVDVMLVLLVIFMVTAPLLTVGVPLDLPKTSAAELVQPKEPIVLSLDREGDTFIGNEPVAASDLRDRLAQPAADDPGRIHYGRRDRTISSAPPLGGLGLVNTTGLTK